MKVLLSQDVKGLGQKGAVVQVSDGYARNYLLPRGLAEAASEGGLRRQKLESQQIAQKRAREMDDARQLAHKLEQTNVVLTVKAGSGGKLFGAITAKDIASALKKQAGLNLDKRRIQLDQPIKQLGTTRVTVKPHADVSASMAVTVQAEEV